MHATAKRKTLVYNTVLLFVVEGSKINKKVVVMRLVPRIMRRQQRFCDCFLWDDGRSYRPFMVPVHASGYGGFHQVTGADFVKLVFGEPKQHGLWWFLARMTCWLRAFRRHHHG